MLYFYYTNENHFTNWVTDKLEEMVVAHKIIRVDNNQQLPKEVSVQKLPMLSDEHEHWHSEDEIKSFLNKLHQDLELSQSLQSDACHIDPDNPNQCL